MVELQFDATLTRQTRLGKKNFFIEIQPSAMEKPTPPPVRMGPHLPLFLPGSSDDEGENGSGTGPPISRSVSDEPRLASEEPGSRNCFRTNAPVSTDSDSGKSNGRHNFSVGLPSALLSDSEESYGQTNLGVGLPSVSLLASEESDGPCNFGVGMPIEFSDSEESDGRDDFRVNVPVSLSASKRSEGMNDFIWLLPTLINLYCSGYT